MNILLILVAWIVLSNGVVIGTGLKDYNDAIHGIEQVQVTLDQDSLIVSEDRVYCHECQRKITEQHYKDGKPYCNDCYIKFVLNRKGNK